MVANQESPEFNMGRVNDFVKYMDEQVSIKPLRFVKKLDRHWTMVAFEIKSNTISDFLKCNYIIKYVLFVCVCVCVCVFKQETGGSVLRPYQNKRPGHILSGLNAFLSAWSSSGPTSPPPLTSLPMYCSTAMRAQMASALIQIVLTLLWLPTRNLLSTMC